MLLLFSRVLWNQLLVNRAVVGRAVSFFRARGEGEREGRGGFLPGDRAGLPPGAGRLDAGLRPGCPDAGCGP